MRKYLFYTIVFTISFLVIACSGRRNKADAFGSFEAEELILSAQMEGQILDFDTKQGSAVKAGQYLGTIDSTNLVFQKQQVQNQINTFSKQYSILPKKFINLNDSLIKIENQIWTINDNINWDSKTKEKLAKLQKQKNDIIEAIAKWKDDNSSLQGLANQAEQLYFQLRQMNFAISKCRIISPISGIVLTQYVKTYELIGKGYPVAKIANLKNMTLKVFVSERQLANIKLGQECTVRIDKNKTEKAYKGKVLWISDESEFTPKMIQTKEERVNLVYAVKINVNNDGDIKIGMPGEVVF